MAGRVRWTLSRRDAPLVLFQSLVGRNILTRRDLARAAKKLSEALRRRGVSSSVAGEGRRQHGLAGGRFGIPPCTLTPLLQAPPPSPPLPEPRAAAPATHRRDVSLKMQTPKTRGEVTLKLGGEERSDHRRCRLTPSQRLARGRPTVTCHTNPNTAYFPLRFPGVVAGRGCSGGVRGGVHVGMWRGPVAGVGRKRKSALALFHEEAFGTWEERDGRVGRGGRGRGGWGGGVVFFRAGVTLCIYHQPFTPPQQPLVTVWMAWWGRRWRRRSGRGDVRGVEVRVSEVRGG
ncbi:hypothetical protein E2C01_058033 [Portunus trituberculatus]|uniref:Uncharacterized protein n=1 Tax=Portunus trituberculatus TaxID=210409 RepID=A0A5B7H2P0_PORTR|nr:hypothetical protein [Portunus trituberculatus]